MSTDEQDYNGWTNRETWAVHTHISKNAEWLAGIHDALRAMLADDDENSWFGRSRAGDVVQAVAAEYIHERLTLGDPHELANILTDIGSPWRVDWHAVGDALIADLPDYEA